MSRSLRLPITVDETVAELVVAGASRMVPFERVRPARSLTGESGRRRTSCSIVKPSRMVDAAGSISQISAMILRAFSKVRIAIVEACGM